jgi:hypothetical protein
MALVLRQARAVVDNRTTMVCLHISGAITSTDLPFETLAGDFMDPPFHIHCRTIVGPWMPGMVNDLAEEANAEMQRRPKKDRRIGPDGEIGGRVPPPSDVNSPTGFSFPGSEEAAWKPKRRPAALPEAPPLSKDQAADWFNKHAHLPSEAERYSVGLYVGGGRMNGQLRDDKFDDLTREHIKTIDKLIGKQAPTKDPILVYRGMSPQFIPEEGDLVGVTIKDPAYLSTALDVTNATLFSGRTGNQGGVLLEITLPEGSKVLPMNLALMRDQSDVPEEFREPADVLKGESEILLPHGTALRVVSDAPSTIAGIVYRLVKAVIVND